MSMDHALALTSTDMVLGSGRSGLRSSLRAYAARADSKVPCNCARNAKKSEGAKSL